MTTAGMLRVMRFASTSTKDGSSVATSSHSLPTSGRCVCVVPKNDVAARTHGNTGTDGKFLHAFSSRSKTRLEISGQAEFFPGPCFFQACEVVFLRPIVRIAA